MARTKSPTNITGKTVVEATDIVVKTFLFVFILGTMVFGAENAVQTAVSSEPAEQWMYVGMDLGYSLIKSDAAAEARSKDGLQYGLQIVAPIHRWNHIIFDVGLGWFRNTIRGNINPQNAVRVRTDMLMIEGAARYELSPTWHLGLMTRWGIGSDTSFAESDQGQKLAILIGPTLLHTIPLEEKLNLRVGANVLTSLNLGDRQYHVFQAVAQLGFPIFEKREEKVAKRDIQRVVKYFPGKEYEFHVRGDELRIIMDAKSMVFETDRADLTEKAKYFLGKFGSYLTDQGMLWSSMTIEGHADQRGSLPYNDNLSEDRAEVVRDYLLKRGIPTERMARVGYGERRPRSLASTPSAWAANRRIELVVTGIRRIDSFTNEVSRVRMETLGKGDLRTVSLREGI